MLLNLDHGLRRGRSSCCFGRRVWQVPVRVAEQRSKRGSRPRGLSEWRAQTKPLAQQSIRATSSAAARVCEQRREPRAFAGRRTRGCFSLVTFFCTSKRKWL